MRLDDDDLVRDQYRTTEKLETRISVWRPDSEGRWPQDVAVEALAGVRPMSLLEVGSGTGALAQRCAAELSCKVTAVDSSQEMVAATAARGIRAMLGDVQELPFPDGTFDAAVAAWMLYHVPDRDQAISELARVLRPGGRLVAITNGRDHLAELWHAVECEGFETGFSGENGGAQLERHFARVVRHDVHTSAVFPDRAAAAEYLKTLAPERGDLASHLPDFSEPFIARGAPVVFVADK
jgi:SAM-dependent methyltransferase